jgi:hypothetical protein
MKSPTKKNRFCPPHIEVVKRLSLHHCVAFPQIRSNAIVSSVSKQRHTTVKHCNDIVFEIDVSSLGGLQKKHRSQIQSPSSDNKDTRGMTTYPGSLDTSNMAIITHIHTLSVKQKKPKNKEGPGIKYRLIPNIER